MGVIKVAVGGAEISMRFTHPRPEFEFSGLFPISINSLICLFFGEPTTTLTLWLRDLANICASVIGLFASFCGRKNSQSGRFIPRLSCCQIP